MSSLPAAEPGRLALFEPPYHYLVPCSFETVAALADVDAWRGRALVWQLVDETIQAEEYELLRRKPAGVPLLVLLPPPAQLRQVLALVAQVRVLSPRMILPHGMLDTTYRLRQVLAMAPRGVPDAVTDYLIRRGVLRDRATVEDFRRIIELAPNTRSITELARRMYTSRRTLGRHFISAGLPVPSHCLQFARILNVALHLQSEDGAVFRIAARFGYPDGFTMSNQMKRLIGCRPTEARELLGWEWIVEAWLKREGYE